MENWSLEGKKPSDRIKVRIVNKNGDRNLDGAILHGIIAEINEKYQFAKLKSGWCCHTKDDLLEYEPS